LKSVEEEFAKVLSEKEQIFNEKSLLESECYKLKEKESKLLKDFEDLKTEIKNSENNATLNQTIEVRTNTKKNILYVRGLKHVARECQDLHI
jgi:predicted nuclease with TOPRIM domain